MMLAAAFAAGSALLGAGLIQPHRQDARLRHFIPILEYHVVRDRAEGQFIVARDDFKRDLALLYDRGFRPITVSQLLDQDYRDVPPGLSPVVFTFDDASPEQFSYVERDGRLEIDSTSVVGIWLAFAGSRPDWKGRATFCVLSGADAGHSFFGNNPKWHGQRGEWRFAKLRWLVDNGFELCNHTVWHARLSDYGDNAVRELIARGQLAIDSAVPGYRVRTFALPQGQWPRNRALAWRGSWTDPKTRITTTYEHETVLEVAGGPEPGPQDAGFDRRQLKRFIVFGDRVRALIDRLDSSQTRFRTPR